MGNIHSTEMDSRLEELDETILDHKQHLYSMHQDLDKNRNGKMICEDRQRNIMAKMRELQKEADKLREMYSNAQISIDSAGEIIGELEIGCRTIDTNIDNLYNEKKKIIKEWESSRNH